MTLSKALLASAATLLLSGIAQAEDTRFSVSAGLLINQGNTVDLTQKTSGGYTFEADTLFSPENFGPKIQVYLGYAHFTAAEGTFDRPTFVLSSPRLGVDLVYKPWDALPISFEVGPSFHIWKGDQKGGDPALYPADQHLKLGWRVGVGYDVSTHWAMSLRYTFTEWRTSPNLELSSTNPSRPAYFSLMATYRF